ncbi:MAG: class I SAM-dependent methyltransferase [Acidimicrobiales bacterium]|jgi:SAM-dependent methyltransferase
MDRRVAKAGKFWDRAARGDGTWYVATGYLHQNDEFFAQGARETDTFLDFCRAAPAMGQAQAVLEIGCGLGRMTHRLAQLFARVVAVDVSEEMLRRCRGNLKSFSNVDYLQVPGDGTLEGIADEEVDLVFSYLTLQHVPAPSAQLRYLENSARVLRAGGRIAVQMRSASPVASVESYAAHAVHLLQGRHTYGRCWRGSHVKPSVALQRLSSQGVDAEALVWPFRPALCPPHLWLVGTKAPTLT